MLLANYFSKTDKHWFIYTKDELPFKILKFVMYVCRGH